MATELFGAGGITIPIGPNLHDIQPSGLRLGVRPFDPVNAMSWPTTTVVPARFFKPNSQLTISASGTIWSGVWFTGDTDPDGWRDFGADSSFLLPGTNVPRYGLIGALVAADSFPTDPTTVEWFFIGRGPKTITGTLSDDALLAHGGDVAAATADPAFFKQLFLAVNRPPTNGPLDNGGEHSWTVTVRCVDFDPTMDLPDCTATPPGPTTAVGRAFCIGARDAITAPGGPIDRGHQACRAAQTARDNLAGYNAGLAAAVAVCAGAYTGLIALLVIAPGGAAPATSQTTTVHHFVFTALDAVGAAIAGVLAAPVGAGIAAAVQLNSLVGSLVTLLTSVLAVLTAVAIEAAVQVAVLWYWIAMAIALAFALAMLLVVIGEAAAVSSAARDLDTADIDFAHALQDYDLAFARAVQLCCLPNVTTTPPTC